MRRGVVVWMGCAILLAGVAVARAGHELSDGELRVELMRNQTMASYVQRNGMPDVAETHFLADRPPWDKYEVRLYYLETRLEIAFARAFLLGRRELSMVRSQRPLSDEEVAALASRARPRDTGAVAGSRMGPAERAEEAARRAEAAAGRVEAAVETVERAAERAEAIVAKMETAPRRGRGN